MDWLTQDSCYPVSNLVISIFNATLSAAVIGISGTGTARMILHNCSVDAVTDHKKLPASLFYCQLSFYAMCCINSVCRLLDILGSCVLLYSLRTKHILLFLYLTSYIYHWVTLLAILFLRLHVVFDNSWLKMRHCHHTVSIAVTVSASALYLFSYVSLATELIPFRANMLLVSLMVLVFLAYSVVLALTFVVKLFCLNKVKRMQQSDQGLLSTMTRYTILSMISVVGSVCVIAIALVIGVGGSLDPMLHFLASSLSLDILLDTLCVSLSLTFFDSVYEKLCHGLHTRCSALCEALTERCREEAERKITALKLSVPSSDTDGGLERGGEEIPEPANSHARIEPAIVSIEIGAAGGSTAGDEDEAEAANPDLGDEFFLSEAEHFSELYAQVVMTSTKL